MPLVFAKSGKGGEDTLLPMVTEPPQVETPMSEVCTPSPTIMTKNRKRGGEYAVKDLLPLLNSEGGQSSFPNRNRRGRVVSPDAMMQIFP